MGGRKPMLMSYQFSLPKLSVPSIHDTMNRVCIQHLLTQSDFLNLLYDKQCIFDNDICRISYWIICINTSSCKSSLFWLWYWLYEMEITSLLSANITMLQNEWSKCRLNLIFSTWPQCSLYWMRRNIPEWRSWLESLRMASAKNCSATWCWSRTGPQTTCLIGGRTTSTSVAGLPSWSTVTSMQWYAVHIKNTIKD